MILEARFEGFSNFKFGYDTPNIGQSVNSPSNDIFLFPKENYYTSEENYLNEIRLKRQRNDFARKLIFCIKEQHFEYGITSKADILISEEMAKNRLATKNTLNELFVNNFDNPTVLIGILQVISRNDKINPEGQMMALTALSHKNFEVRECGIRCFENWVSQASLTILKNISTEPQWLQDYLNTVIDNIEEELCHI